MTTASDLEYGAAWLRSYGKSVSPAGARCANYLNWVFDGIYHVQEDVVRANWSHPSRVTMTLYAKHGKLNSYDSDLLLRLVVGAFDHGIRLTIEPCNGSHLRLTMHPRNFRQGHFFETIPFLERALRQLGRRQYPAINPVGYRDELEGQGFLLPRTVSPS